MNDQTPLTRQERIIIALHQLLREIREHAGLDAGTALADLPQAIADLRKRAIAGTDAVIELRAAQMFGGGIFADSVKPDTRNWYQTHARASLLVGKQPA